MTFHIITLFPESLSSYLNESILKRAIEDKKIKIKFYNPRDFSTNHGKVQSYADRRVDNKPYGGGPGMVIEAMPVIKAIQKALGRKDSKKVKIIWFTPSGKKFDTSFAKKYANNYADVVLICGRYEGIDARVKKVFKVDEVSIGDYVLTGGELPAMILLDSISRQVKGVLGDINSLEESRSASPDAYTRPETIEYKKKKYRVPKVLISGNHKLIEEWRMDKKNKNKK